MLKAMIFIDGTWLYSNIPSLRETYNRGDFHIDFGKLPKVLSEQVQKQLREKSIDTVRTHLFGSYAANYDLRDEDAVQKRLDFFKMLKEEYHYEIHTFAVNYRGRRLRKSDRDPKDNFEPKEKCVDISLATNMLYAAAIPNVYDIAIAVIGDADFIPVLQHVRMLGKRVAIAGIKSSCANDLADPHDPAQVKDLDVIWLDDLLKELELKYERHRLQCQSPMHRGRRGVWTTFRPRKGQKFFCDNCRSEFLSQKQQAQEEYVGWEIDEDLDNEDEFYEPVRLAGEVEKKFSDRGFGFIRSVDGKQYFYHFTDLEEETNFEDLSDGSPVEFEVKRQPASDKAGAAQNVRHFSR